MSQLLWNNRLLKFPLLLILDFLQINSKPLSQLLWNVRLSKPFTQLLWNRRLGPAELLKKGHPIFCRIFGPRAAPAAAALPPGRAPCNPANPARISQKKTLLAGPHAARAQPLGPPRRPAPRPPPFFGWLFSFS